jgi:hypothetical protein
VETKKMEGDQDQVPDDRQCAICQEQMNCLSFSPTLEQGQEGDSFRLSCKHAYHSSCVLLAFRTSASTACPCCRNTGASTSSQIVTRGRYSLHITEVDEESEEETEIDMFEIMDNDVNLRRVRCSNQQVKSLRHELKDLRKEYNIFRDQLRNKRRACIKKSLKEFRDENRDSYRKLRQRLLDKAIEVYEKEKSSFIELTSEMEYDSMPWKELHELEKGEKYFKIQSGETRHTDPYNSSFWYA